jgi:hypothetical protein
MRRMTTPGGQLIGRRLAIAVATGVVLVRGGHFDAYVGPGFEISSGAARDWFVDHLLPAAAVPAGEAAASR